MYQNAGRILPARLLAELQRYVAGESLYVPRPGGLRRAWGERSGARGVLARRNVEIRRQHRQGAGVADLAGRFHLSAATIRKILSTGSRA